MPRFQSTLIELTCATCGKSFFVKPSLAPRAKFCSSECSYAASKRSIELECPACGKSFSVIPSKAYRKFCSRRCCSPLVNFRGTVEERFWKYVEKTETCWIWTNAHTPKGYGLISVNGRLISATHVSLQIHGRPNPGGLHALHNCPGGDNPACVNPDHLRWGTRSENMRDRYAKARAHP